MRLMDLLSEEVVTTSLAAAGREEAIAALVRLLVAQGHLAAADAQAVERAVLEREAVQSTGLGGGVAIPHGLSAAVEDVVAALALLPAGVDWGSVDGEPVRLVILLVVPPNAFQAHVRTLAGIARLLNDSDLREQLLAARSPAEVVDVLIEREEAAFS